MSDIIISLDKVRKVYFLDTVEVEALKDISLDIHAGDFVSIAGPSGSGKTTILNLIGCVDKPTSGTVIVHGKRTSDLDDDSLTELRHKSIGFIFQSFNLIPVLNIRENVELPLLLDSRSGSEHKADRKDWVDYLIESVGLKDRMLHTPAELSGGQRQRVGVARALAADPMIMLMDEPFGALDPITRAKLQDEFLKIQAKIKKTIVFVTHDIDEALKMGDRIVVMKAGRIVQYGTPMEILARPADPFVSELIGGRNSLEMMNLLSCGEVMEKAGVATDFKAAAAVSIQATAQDALAEMFRTGQSTVLVLDDQKNVQGLIRLESLLESVSDYGRSN